MIIQITYKFIISPRLDFVKFFRGDLPNLSILRFLSGRFVQPAEPESCTEQMSDFTDKQCDLCKFLSTLSQQPAQAIPSARPSGTAAI